MQPAILLILVNILLSTHGDLQLPKVESALYNSFTPVQNIQLTETITSNLQGFSPFEIEVTQNGEYAYIGFDLSDTVLKMRLDDLSVVAGADLSEYFPIESEDMVLDATGEKLFVHTPSWRKLIVIETASMSVLHVIDEIGVVSIIRSQYGPFLIACDGGSVVRFINTETYEVTEFIDVTISFEMIRESENDQNIWYVAGYQSDGFTVGSYNHSLRSWVQSVVVPYQDSDKNEAIFDFAALPSEQKVYVATLGGWYPDFHAYGWLYSVDLAAGEINVLSIDGGALCLEVSWDSQRLYVGVGWPASAGETLLVVETQSDRITEQIYLGITAAGNYYTQTDDIHLNPKDANLLYITSGDANAFVQVDLAHLAPTGMRFFNEESFGPHFVIKRSTPGPGYILIHQSANAFELDLDTASIEKVVKFPMIRDDVFTYDGAITSDGRLLIPQGEVVLEIRREDMQLLETHPLPPNIAGVWNVVLSNDQKRLYSIWQNPHMEDSERDTLLAIDATDFQIDAMLKLEGGYFEPRPFELPDGSKLYATGGSWNGPIIIKVIETENFTVTKTITFDNPDLFGSLGGGLTPIAYDPYSGTLYVGAFQVVLAIDTHTDVIAQVIKLTDVAEAIGLDDPGWLTAASAAGLVYHPEDNHLYIAHLDRSFVSIYDLNTNQFLPQVIPLTGFSPSDLFANDNYSKLYSLNGRSDNVSVIDTEFMEIEKTIDLHAYVDDLGTPTPSMSPVLTHTPAATVTQSSTPLPPGTAGPTPSVVSGTPTPASGTLAPSATPIPLTPTAIPNAFCDSQVTQGEIRDCVYLPVLVK